MKMFVLISFFVLRVLSAQEAQVDPFAPSMKKAAELIRCANGHETLKDVPIIYGHVGGLMSSPEIAEKAKRGEIILGGCIMGSQDHWVVCQTCGLRYDGMFDAWIEDHPARPFLGESMDNHPCTPETLRRVLSNAYQEFPLEIGSIKPTRTACSRWHDANVVVGEYACFETKAKETDIVAALKAWLPAKERISFSEQDPFESRTKIWKWISDDRAFKLSLWVFGQEESTVRLEWHKVPNAEPPGSVQPGTQPADNPPAEDQPSTPTSKDAPPVAGWQALGVRLRHMRYYLFHFGLATMVALPRARSEESVVLAQSAVAEPLNLASPTKAATMFFAACRSKDLETLRKVVSKRQQASLKKKGHTLEWFAEAWAKYTITSIDGSEATTTTLDGRSTTKVNVTIATASGNEKAQVVFSLEDNEWKMDEN